MTSLVECSLNNISRAVDKCKFAQKYCNDEEMVKFTQFFYCELQESYPILIILSVFVFNIIYHLIHFICLNLLTSYLTSLFFDQIVLILATFHLLSSTAEVYLSPSLAKLSDFFKLSQNLAGVTLLALGNGAPDVFTAIIAGAGGTEDSEGIHLAICSIFGSGIFVTTITLAKVIINAEEIKVVLLHLLVYYLKTILIILLRLIKRHSQEISAFIHFQPSSSFFTQLLEGLISSWRCSSSLFTLCT